MEEQLREALFKYLREHYIRQGYSEDKIISVLSNPLIITELINVIEINADGMLPCLLDKLCGIHPDA